MNLQAILAAILELAPRVPGLLEQVKATLGGSDQAKLQEAYESAKNESDRVYRESQSL